MVQQIKAANFEKEVLQASGSVVVDFFATWCGPCQGMMPILENLTGKLPAGAKVVKIDVDEAPELASRYGVMSIPSFKVFKNGKIVSEAVGMQSIDQLLAMVA
jgi:thioredoxin 1